ncbi:MAG: LysR family transcriptional regulator [Pararhodobacter sp.]
MINLSGFDLNLLRVLDALLREGSTVRAGDRLGLSQPAVSAALGRLRHALGDPLFVRQGQRLVPTAFAQRLESPLRDALAGLESLLRGPDEFDPAQAVLDFRISGTDYFAALLMPALARRVGSAAPGVRLQLVDLVRDNHVDTLNRYQIDLALVPQTTFPAWLDHEALFAEAFVVIARPDHPRLRGLAPGSRLPLDLFCELGHVLCSPEGKFHGQTDMALERAGRSRRVAVTVPVFEGVANIIAQSDYIALFPSQLALARQARGDLVLYWPPIAIAPPHLCAIWHRRMRNDPAHRWLRGQIAEILRPLNWSAQDQDRIGKVQGAPRGTGVAPAL